MPRGGVKKKKKGKVGRGPIERCVGLVVRKKKIKINKIKLGDAVAVCLTYRGNLCEDSV